MTTLTELQTFEPRPDSPSTSQDAIALTSPKVLGDEEIVVPDIRQPRQRGRPACFRNTLHEILFVFVVASAQLMLVFQR